MNPDPELKKILALWKTEARLPADFKSEVWQRISQRAESPSWVDKFFSFLEPLWAVPRFAIATAAFALVIGTSLGYVQGNAQAGALGQRLEATYADSINPLSRIAQDSFK